MSAMRADKRARIARETLEIYAPIALRLGLNKLYRELQDCRSADPPASRRGAGQGLNAARGNRKELLTRILDGIRDKLAHAGLRPRFSGARRASTRSSAR
jgi:GTP pyrophosphokinase/guanosine-3',5'-bis(diphosphate) 3'-pyrophosphohydrolase